MNEIGGGAAPSVTTTLVAWALPTWFLTLIPKVYSIGFSLLLAAKATVFVKLSEPHAKDFEKPFRPGETVILQETAYFSFPFKTTLPPEFATVVLEIVKDLTTGIAVGLAVAPAGVPTVVTITIAIGTATDIAHLDRTLEPNMNSLALPVDGSPRQGK